MFITRQVPFELDNSSRNTWKFDFNTIAILFLLIYTHTMVCRNISKCYMAFTQLFILLEIIYICCEYIIQIRFNAIMSEFLKVLQVI